MDLTEQQLARLKAMRQSHARDNGSRDVDSLTAADAPLRELITSLSDFAAGHGCALVPCPTCDKVGKIRRELRALVMPAPEKAKETT